MTRRRPIEAALKETDLDNLDLLPADFSYRNMDLELDDTKKRTRRLGQLLPSVADDYDVAFLDCPPSISLVSENVMHAVDTLLVPLIPATLSLRTFDQLTRTTRPEQRTPDQPALGGHRRRNRRSLSHGGPADRPQLALDVAESLERVL